MLQSVFVGKAHGLKYYAVVKYHPFIIDGKFEYFVSMCDKNEELIKFENLIKMEADGICLEWILKSANGIRTVNGANHIRWAEDDAKFIYLNLIEPLSKEK